MAQSGLAPELLRFIARYISSIERLEILSLFYAEPAKSFQVAEVVRKVQSSERSVKDCLQWFLEHGFLGQPEEGAYKFSPGTNELAEGTAALAKAYREKRVSIVEAIYSQPSSTIQDFADAFKLRKDK
jgi:DNA-binding IclR family transcriptional regulator